MGNRISQKERILDELYVRGDAGLPSRWFWENRIQRGAARIHDLKKAGHKIESRPDPDCQDGGVIYFLVEDNQLGLGI